MMYSETNPLRKMVLGGGSRGGRPRGTRTGQGVRRPRVSAQNPTLAPMLKNSFNNMLMQSMGTAVNTKIRNPIGLGAPQGQQPAGAQPNDIRRLQMPAQNPMQPIPQMPIQNPNPYATQAASPGAMPQSLPPWYRPGRQRPFFGGMMGNYR